MALYIDVSAAVHRRAGLGRYAHSLTCALARLIPDRLSLFYNREQGVEPLSGLESLPAHTIGLGYKPWRMLVWAGQLSRVGFNRLVPGAELLHATEHLLLPLHHVPTILTVHDLIFRRYPGHHKLLNRLYLNLTMPLYCRRATHIIAVSRHTRRDLMAAYGLPAEKITVVHEAADGRFRPQSPEAVTAARARYGLPARYVLFVGTIEPRKNLLRLLAAFERVHVQGLTDALVIVGRRGWLHEPFFAELARSPAQPAVIFPGFVPDADLPPIYAGAQALAFPSLYEGFGLPVLEAMACGTPVVCAENSSLPEIAGSAAVLVDALDVEGLAAGLSRIISDEILREELRERGMRQAARFSWERTARETLALYQRFIG